MVVLGLISAGIFFCLQDSSSLTVQERLDRVWSLLCMPDALRLDMAIKYSSETYFDKLDEVFSLEFSSLDQTHFIFFIRSLFLFQMIVHWEAAVKLILSRENLITRLEDFERFASDPNRFFEKGVWN